jgi:FkbM family methyltransferase
MISISSIAIQFRVKTIKAILNNFFGYFGFKLVSNDFFKRAHLESEQLSRIQGKSTFLNRVSHSPETRNILDAIFESKSQLYQDLFVLETLQYKKNGIFVEFGAGDGIHLSNTYLLEKFFQWDGVLAEPAKGFHKSLHNSRKAKISERLVWSKSDEEIDFFENEIGELSGSHSVAKARIRDSYKVRTVTLLDLLIEYELPNFIDFLSIDTEGSELEILEKFDFDLFKFGVICVEHNYSANQEPIHQLLSRNGYIRVLESESVFDDWYIQSETGKLGERKEFTL